MVGSEHGVGDSHGTFFLTAGAAQAVAAVAVAARSTRRRVTGAAVLAAALIATWLVVKAPEALTGSDVDPLAIIATASEVVTVLASLHLLRQPARRLVAARGNAGGRGIAAFALATAATFGIAGFGESDHTHHHDETVTTLTVGGSPDDDHSPDHEPIPDHDEGPDDHQSPDHEPTPDHDQGTGPDEGTEYDEADEADEAGQGDHSHADAAPHGH